MGMRDPENEILDVMPSREAFWAVIAMIGFSILLPIFGVLPAVFALVFMMAAGNKEFQLLRTIVTATVISALCIGIFVQGLGMPLKIFSFPWR